VVEERGDVDVTVTLEGVEEVGGAGGTGGLLRGMTWGGGSSGSVRL
jgi:hypothetical protein